jgi:Tol biopolymer transport system component
MHVRTIVAVLAFITAAGAAQPIRSEAPAVSPDGTRIAFLSNKDGNDDVYVVARDGTGEVRLTNTPDEKSRPSWSADGKHVWFSSFASGVSRIYSIDPDGRNLKQIGTVPGRAATLSHNAKRVLYSTGGWTSVRLSVSNLDGSHARILADNAPVLWNVQWSPDDKRIAYTGRSPEEKALSVWIMNADGSHPRQITHLAPGEGGAQLPAWSSDGRQIAMQANDPDPKKHDAHIWVVDVKTGAAHDLTPHAEPYLDEIPSWFPDGKQIAFQSDRTGRMEIWVMNADGSGQHALKAP